MGHLFTLTCNYRYIWNKKPLYIQGRKLNPNLIKSDLFNNPLTHDIY